MKNKTKFDYLNSTSTSSFKDAVYVEKNMQYISNGFYKFLNALQVRRYDWNDPAGKYMQKRDVDCSIQLEAPGIDVFWLNVSEKFRRDTFDNFCIEIWSNLEEEIDGWATQKDSAADVYLSVSPFHIFSIWRNRNFIAMVNEIQEYLTPEKIKEYDWSSRKTIDIEVNGHKMKLLKNKTKGLSGEEWHGVCVIIDFDTLINEYFIDINKYNVMEPHVYKKVNL